MRKLSKRCELNEDDDEERKLINQIDFMKKMRNLINFFNNIILDIRNEEKKFKKLKKKTL